MKEIYVLRHAKSSWDNSNLSDFERPLADRGIRDAKKMSKFLKDMDLKIDKVLCSNALRAKETFDLTADCFNFEIDKNMSQSNDLSLTKLFDYSSASDQASFQWNISIPITILILLLYGIYISSSKPREGKFSFMLPGMLIYVSYLSLLILGREFISDNPGSIFNLWFIHGLFILFLFLYAYREKIIFVSFANLAIQENIYLRYFIGIMIFILFIWMVA